MSGLYGQMFGRQPEAGFLCSLLDQASAEDFAIGRFRDAWVEKQGNEIVIAIYTRNGGGNRDDYAYEIMSMQTHPWYLTDDDDEFDNTYATFYFRVPSEVASEKPHIWEALNSIAQEPVDTGARWADLIKRLNGS